MIEFTLRGFLGEKRSMKKDGNRNTIPELVAQIRNKMCLPYAVLQLSSQDMRVLRFAERAADCFEEIDTLLTVIVQEAKRNA